MRSSQAQTTTPGTRRGIGTTRDRRNLQTVATLACATADNALEIASGETVPASAVVDVPVTVLGHVINQTSQPRSYRSKNYAIVYVTRQDDGRVLAVRIGGARAMEQLKLWQADVPYSAILTLSRTANDREMQVWQRRP